MKRGGVMGAGAIMAQRQVRALLNKKKGACMHHGILKIVGI